MNSYTRVCIDLHDDHCIGAVVQIIDERSYLYVMHRNGGMANVQLTSLLRPGYDPNLLVHMRALRTWYASHFSDDLFGDRLSEEDERTAWYVSAFDA